MLAQPKYTAQRCEPIRADIDAEEVPVIVVYGLAARGLVIKDYVLASVKDLRWQSRLVGSVHDIKQVFWQCAGFVQPPQCVCSEMSNDDMLLPRGGV